MNCDTSRREGNPELPAPSSSPAFSRCYLSACSLLLASWQQTSSDRRYFKELSFHADCFNTLKTFIPHLVNQRSKWISIDQPRVNPCAFVVMGSALGSVVLSSSCAIKEMRSAGSSQDQKDPKVCSNSSCWPRDFNPRLDAAPQRLMGTFALRAESLGKAWGGGGVLKMELGFLKISFFKHLFGLHSNPSSPIRAQAATSRIPAPSQRPAVRTIRSHHPGDASWALSPLPPRQLQLQKNPSPELQLPFRAAKIGLWRRTDTEQRVGAAHTTCAWRSGSRRNPRQLAPCRSWNRHVVKLTLHPRACSGC